MDSEPERNNLFHLFFVSTFSSDLIKLELVNKRPDAIAQVLQKHVQSHQKSILRRHRQVKLFAKRNVLQSDGWIAEESSTDTMREREVKIKTWNLLHPFMKQVLERSISKQI